MSEVLYEVNDNIGHIILNRPETRNAITFTMYEKVSEICSRIELNGGISCVIISGAGGKAFAAGTDISLFDDFTEPEHALEYEKKIDRVLSNIEQCPVPVIAAITGACTGGGAAIASACDIRICDSKLAFGFPIARTLGNCLSLRNLHRLSELIGSPRLREILITARLIGAEEGKQIGLISDIVEDNQTVLNHAFDLARKISGHSPLSIYASKQGLLRIRNNMPEMNDDDLITKCYMSEDFKEGMNAFLNKRVPQWKGK